MSGTNDTHDPARRSWVESANDGATGFPIQNLPYGVFRRAGVSEPLRPGVAIGTQIVDLLKCSDLGLLAGLAQTVQQAARLPLLNMLMAIDPRDAAGLRRRLVTILDGRESSADPRILVPMDEAELALPVAIGDYTDFYASIHHATRVGRLFRPDNPLLPNYKHIPIAYHGRSSSIVPSGTPIHRPSGQVKGADNLPVVKRSERLDYEAEVGFFIGPGNGMGSPIPLDDAEQHVFGLCLVNDWSVRDIQAWEAQPLGPFLSKNFATSVSPWIVTIEALAPFRCPASARPPDDPKPLPYLSSPHNEQEGGIEIVVETLLASAEMRRRGQAPVSIGRGSLADMYWTLAQMVAHHTSNGCNLRPGDLLASGTISGPSDGSEGCLLEKTRLGASPLSLPTGETRVFLAEGDELILRAQCERAGCAAIGFGECRGIVA